MILKINELNSMIKKAGFRVARLKKPIETDNFKFDDLNKLQYKAILEPGTKDFKEDVLKKVFKRNVISVQWKNLEEVEIVLESLVKLKDNL